MDLEAIAGVEPPVDEVAVQHEIEVYVSEQHLDSTVEPWKIGTLGQADWAMRRLVDVERQATEYRDEVALWSQALRRIEAAGEWFADRLKEWGVSTRAVEPTRKTFNLPHGTVRTSERKPGVEVVDEDAVIAWAKEHAPTAVKVTEKFLVSESGVRVVECVVAIESTSKTTGELERIPVKRPAPLDESYLDTLRARLGDGFVVDAITQPMVVDEAGDVVPGLAVKPGSLSATVTPIVGSRLAVGQ